jgi:hypothetical protein
MERSDVRRWTRIILGTSTLALAVGFLGGWAASGGLESAAAFPAPGGHGDDMGVRLSAAGERVASGLKCPCGCPNLLLACGCSNPRGASEVKRYIMDTLAAGRSESDVRIELTNRYGAAIQGAAR